MQTGQDPAVAEVTGTFTRAYVWGMVPYVVFENAKRCLQVTEDIDPMNGGLQLQLPACVDSTKKIESCFCVGHYPIERRLSFAAARRAANYYMSTYYYRPTTVDRDEIF